MQAWGLDSEPFGPQHRPHLKMVKKSVEVLAKSEKNPAKGLVLRVQVYDNKRQNPMQ